MTAFVKVRKFKMKFYAMESKINPNGVQEFFPVWFNKKKL